MGDVGGWIKFKDANLSFSNGVSVSLDEIEVVKEKLGTLIADSVPFEVKDVMLGRGHISYTGARIRLEARGPVIVIHARDTGAITQEQLDSEGVQLWAKQQRAFLNFAKRFGERMMRFDLETKISPLSEFLAMLEQLQLRVRDLRVEYVDTVTTPGRTIRAVLEIAGVSVDASSTAAMHRDASVVRPRMRSVNISGASVTGVRMILDPNFGSNRDEAPRQMQHVMRQVAVRRAFVSRSGGVGDGEDVVRRHHHPAPPSGAPPSAPHDHDHDHDHVAGAGDDGGVLRQRMADDALRRWSVIKDVSVTALRASESR